MGPNPEVLEKFRKKAELVSAIVSEVDSMAQAIAYTVDLCSQKEACQLLMSGCEESLSDKGRDLCELKQFGKIISAHQAVRHALVDAQTKLRACDHMLYHAAWLAQMGRPCAVESSMAKLFVGETALEIALACQKIMGAYGCAEEYDMERYVRDLTCMPIVGGSSNMQRNNIAGRMRLAG